MLTPDVSSIKINELGTKKTKIFFSKKKKKKKPLDLQPFFSSPLVEKKLAKATDL
jgi:hypothetical protein